ncbi:bacteriocin fulvocin C-related protein [Promicromonospora sp. NPDC057488]|uniref:bacteriocin fulvocin C-related protein n=1 Tax=Promicromonospora sp. NPDC057488 TaxID=3346147 RepID=UPI00366F991C
MHTTTWILAFDASCCQCRQVAEQVERAGDGRLDVRPLERPEVRAWREQVFGPEPPHAPTLIKVPDDGAVRAWTGPVMVARTAARLGPRLSLRLLGALGALRRGGEAAERDGLGRAQFLRLALVGAGALVLGGGQPAVAAAPSAAQRWVQANRHALPQDYTAFAAHDVAHRRAIYAESTAATRSELWTAQLVRYRDAHGDLSAARRAVVDRALRIAGDQNVFTGRVRPGTALAEELTTLTDDAVAAFGVDEGRALLASLGPEPGSRSGSGEQGAAAVDCGCNLYYGVWCSNYCYGCTDCPCPECTCSDSGCGTFWVHECNGVCR